MKKTLLSLLQSAVDSSADAYYLYKKCADGWKGYTFKQIQDKAIALSAYLRNKVGLGDMDKIAILAEGSPEWAITELGVLHNRSISVPLSLKLLIDEVQFRLDHSESKMIACSKITINKIKEIASETLNSIKILYLDEDRSIIEQAIQNKELKEENVFYFNDALTAGSDLLSQHAINLSQQEVMQRVQEDDIATISYSSGTTGNPKGVMLTHANYYINTTYPADYHYFPAPEEFKLLVILPVDHAFAHTVGLYIGMLQRAQLYFLDARGGAAGMIRAIPENIKEVQPYMLMVVPALAQNFMKKINQNIQAKGKLSYALFRWSLHANIRYNGDLYHKPSPWVRMTTALPRLIGGKLIFPKIKEALPIKMLLGGGALIDRKLQEFFWGINLPFYLGYGMTETSPVVSVTGSKPGAMKMGSVGRFFKQLEGKIVRSDGTTCDAGEIGEIVLKGPTIMHGYFKNEQATKEMIRDGWLHTGDRGYLDKDGFLFIAGREKALLISKEGEKYSPEEIEEAIQSSSRYIQQALLYCDHNPYSSALFVLNEEALKQRIRELREKSLLKLIRSIDISDELKDRFSKMKRSQIKEALNFSSIAKQEKPIDLEALLKEISEDTLSFKDDSTYKNAFPKVWLPNTFVLLDEPFEVNSTMKVVRFKVISKHQDDLNFMYTTDGASAINKRNLELLAKVVSKLQAELEAEDHA